MDDLRARFSRELSGISVPDLRERIRGTHPTSMPPDMSSRRNRVLVILTSLAIATVGLSAALWSFRPGGESQSGADSDPTGEIAFASAATGVPTLWIVEPGADGPRPLLDDVEVRASFEPDWSPDGQRIVFRAEREEEGAGSDYDLFVVDVDTMTIEDITEDLSSRTSEGTPTWAPTGDRIAYVADSNSGSSIYTWTADDGSHLQLTSEATDVDPSWSPDGNAVAFTRLEEEGGQLRADIWTVSADAESLVRLTSDPGYDAEPAWSPAGTEIAFISDRDGSIDVYVMQSNGENQNPLTNISAEDIEGLAWSPDGSAIAFQAYRGGTWDVFLVDVATSNVTVLASSDDDEVSPSWSPDGLHVAYLGGPPVSEDISNGSRRDVYIVLADGSEAQRVTWNARALAGLSWG